jgi:hypothetical protein
VKFPAVFLTAVIKNKKLWFKQSMTDDELVELMAWKAALGIGILTPAKLRTLHRSQQYSKEIFAIFRNSGKISYLEQESQRRRKIT